jgi:hypothetical protein
VTPESNVQAERAALVARGVGAELVSMTSFQAVTRPSALLRRLAVVAALIGALALAPGAEAKAASGSGHGKKVAAGDRSRKKSGRNRTARASGTKRRRKEKPAPEETPPAPTPAPEEATTIPTQTTEEPAPTPTEPAPAPAPSPTEEPAPAPSGSLLFLGDQIKDFYLNQSAPNAITEVGDPAGSSQKVFKMVVADSDVYPITPTENPRAQLLSPTSIKPGDEIWWHSKFFLPGSFPSSVPGWLNLLEGPYGSPFNGSPPWQIQVVGNSIQWTRNRTYAWDVPWKMPLVKEKWVDVLVHERFGSSGFVEMWINGQQVTFFSGGTYNPAKVAPTTHLDMATMDSSNNGAPNSIILQSYREAGMLGSVSVFEGPLTIGTSRAAVGG